MICVLVYTLIFINDTPLLGSVELFFFFLMRVSVHPI